MFTNLFHTIFLSLFLLGKFQKTAKITLGKISSTIGYRTSLIAVFIELDCLGIGGYCEHSIGSKSTLFRVEAIQ